MFCRKDMVLSKSIWIVTLGRTVIGDKQSLDRFACDLHSPHGI